MLCPSLRRRTSLWVPSDACRWVTTCVPNGVKAWGSSSRSLRGKSVISSNDSARPTSSHRRICLACSGGKPCAASQARSSAGVDSKIGDMLVACIGSVVVITSPITGHHRFGGKTPGNLGAKCLIVGGFLKFYGVRQLWSRATEEGPGVSCGQQLFCHRLPQPTNRRCSTQERQLGNGERSRPRSLNESGGSLWSDDKPARLLFMNERVLGSRQSETCALACASRGPECGPQLGFGQASAGAANCAPASLVRSR